MALVAQAVVGGRDDLCLTHILDLIPRLATARVIPTAHQVPSQQAGWRRGDALDHQHGWSVQSQRMSTGPFLIGTVTWKPR